VRIEGVINYAARTDFRLRCFANDHSGDTVVINQVAMPFIDGRTMLLSFMPRKSAPCGWNTAKQMRC
jgi:hypothetical protein